MTRQLVRREIKTEPEQIVSVVREAMEVLPAASRDVRIFLHPEDAEILKKTLSTTDNNYWKLLEDPILARGDCRVHTETSSIDATVEYRLASVVAQMLGGVRKADAERSDDADNKNDDSDGKP
jgi:flagellar assembly protein FliH